MELFTEDLPNLDLLKGKSIAIDSEAMGLDVKNNRLCLVQICDEAGNIFMVKFNGTYNSPNLIKLMEDRSVTKIFHFARFDVAIINHYLGCDINNIYCTKIASKLVRTYTDSHGLKALAAEILKITLNKGEQSSYWGDEELTESQKNYAGNDVKYLHELKQKLAYMLQREGKTELAQSCFEFLKTRAKLDLCWEQSDIFKH